MGENQSKSKASNDYPNLLDEEALAGRGLSSGGTLRLYPVSGPSSSTHYEPLQEETKEVSPDNTDKAIFEAVERGDPETLSNLLTNCTTEVNNTNNEEGNTALHHAVTTVCQKGELGDSFYQCINVLMNCQQMNVNMPNKKGYTAIGYALNQLHKSCVDSMLTHPSAKRLHLDYYPGDREYTVREIIMETYPDLEPLLPEPLMESLDSSEIDIKLLAALQRADYKTFEENILHLPNPNPCYGEPYHSSLLEIACQLKNRKPFVKLLFDKVADLNIKNHITDMPLPHATARSGNFELLEMLLTNTEIGITEKDNEERAITHWWARVSEKNPNDKETLKRCFKCLLEKGFFKNESLEDEDSSGKTPFSIAVERENRDRIILMLDTESDDNASDHIEEILESANKPLMEEILDYCFESNDEPTQSEELKVNLKSEALINLAYFAVDSKQHKELLKHPIMLIFVNLMWKELKIVFFLNVAFYVTFVFSMTAYILFSEFCIIQNNRDVANNSNSPLSLNDNNVTCGMTDERRHNISQFLWYVLMILLGLLFVRELGQLYAYRRDYIISKENWLESLFVIVTFTSCSGIVDSIEVNRHLFAIAILLGWFELVLMLGRLPLLSVQTEMFKTVSLTFLKFMAGYIILIMAFAFSFYILFEGNVKKDDVDMFTNPLISILKTIVMFAGEFEVSSLSFDSLPGTSHVIFLLFVFFVSIVLLNLLNGLAVGDTGRVREEAETLSLVARVRLIQNIYEMCYELPYFKILFLIMSDDDYELFPNQKKNINSTVLLYLRSKINEKRERNKKEKMTEHVENWKFAEKLSALQSQTEEIRKMLKKLLAHQNIPEH